LFHLVEIEVSLEIYTHREKDRERETERREKTDFIYLKIYGSKRQIVADDTQRLAGAIRFLIAFVWRMVGEQGREVAKMAVARRIAATASGQQ
jgi:hypothetical protein